MLSHVFAVVFDDAAECHQLRHLRGIVPPHKSKLSCYYQIPEGSSQVRTETWTLEGVTGKKFKTESIQDAPPSIQERTVEYDRGKGCRA